MEEKIKTSGLGFALKMQRENEPWEHRERAVYTVEALKEEMTARLKPAADDDGEENNRRESDR